MPEQKENNQPMGVEIKTATVSSTRMAVAVAFLGATALAAAAVGTSIRRVEQMAKQQQQYGYIAPVRRVETMLPLYGYNQPTGGYGYNIGTNGYGYGYNGGVPYNSADNLGGALGYGYNNGSNGLWCAYGLSTIGYGFAPRSANYCASVKTLKECTVVLSGQLFTTIEDCKKYLTTIGKK